ncbi:hypothetical protein BH09BAC2_BH09BAC2_20070 [soil metagenome]
MLQFHLAPIFKARGITKPSAFLVKNGFTYHTAHKILNGPPEIRLVHLEQLCRLLHCLPNDLFYWKPDANEKADASLPLSKLTRQIESSRIVMAMEQMPLDQLNEINKIIDGKMKE